MVPRKRTSVRDATNVASSITATIKVAVQNWVSLACSPEESAAEILDRWMRRDAGDVLEGIDIPGILTRSGVTLPAPIASMLEQHMKDATSAAFGNTGLARGQNRSK